MPLQEVFLGCQFLQIFFIIVNQTDICIEYPYAVQSSDGTNFIFSFYRSFVAEKSKDWPFSLLRSSRVKKKRLWPFVLKLLKSFNHSAGSLQDTKSNLSLLCRRNGMLLHRISSGSGISWCAVQVLALGSRWGDTEWKWTMSLNEIWSLGKFLLLKPFNYLIFPQKAGLTSRWNYLEVSGFSHKEVFQPGTHCVGNLVLIFLFLFFFISTAKSCCKGCSRRRQPFLRKLTF